MKKLSFFIALFFVACAQSGARAAQVAPAAVEAGPRGALAEAATLGGVVTGLRDLERRAQAFSQAEWDFVLGYAHFSAGRWSQAEKHLLAASGKIPGLQDYVLYYLAASANRQGGYAKASELLERLGSDYPDSALSADAALERAQALAGLGRCDEALAMLRRLSAGSDGEMQRRIEMVSARTLIDMGDSSRAPDAVERMAMSAGCEEELASLEPLIAEVKKRFGVDIHRALSSASRQLALVRSFTGQSQWSDAAARLEKLLSGGALDARERSEAKWLLARCYRWLHRYDDAIALLKQLSEEPGGGVNGLESTLAILYAKKNEFDKARAVRQSMLDRAPARSRAAADLAFKIAFLYMDQGRYSEAIERFDAVASMRGGDAMLAAWYAGWCRMMNGDSAGALASFDRLLKSGARRAGIEDRVTYWRGRLLARMGRASEARDAFREVQRKYPRGYYAELAARRLAGDERSDADFVRASGAWPSSGSWSPGQIPASGSDRMAKALALDKLGLHAEVGRELKAMDPGDQSQLAEGAMWLAQRNFAHDVSYRLAHSRYKPLLKDSPGRDRFARFVWEQAYPYAYEPVVSRFSDIEGVDPLLVWSIMKNESTFRPKVISPAGAVGLMQLMPTTAQRLAGEAGAAGHSREDLYDPASNIAYGAAYLGRLAKMFDGNAVAMVASYNAGEEAVGRWLANNKSKGRAKGIEEWIEEIPYSETNLYVKKVLNSYWNYQRLYSAQAIANTGPKGQ